MLRATHLGYWGYAVVSSAAMANTRVGSRNKRARNAHNTHRDKKIEVERRMLHVADRLCCSAGGFAKPSHNA